MRFFTWKLELVSNILWLIAGRSTITCYHLCLTGCLCVFGYYIYVYIIYIIHFNKFPWRWAHHQNLLENWLFTNRIYFLFIDWIKQQIDCKLRLPRCMFIMFIIYFMNSFALPLSAFLPLIQIGCFKLVLCFVN